MEYDVIVCGAGPSGTAAALAAARRGARVLLLERYGMAGGMATTALVNPWMGHWFFDRQAQRMTSLTGGIFAELVAAMRAAGACGTPQNPAAFDEEALKLVYDAMLVEAGVTPLFHTQVCGVRTSGRRITGIETASKSGQALLRGRIVIDATGDADVAAFANATHTVGRPADGLAQAMTLSFRMAGVDKAPLLARGGLKASRQPVDELFQAARAAGRLEFPHRDFVQFYDYPRPGVLHFNMTRITGRSGLDAADLTAAEIEGRRQAKVLADWLVREAPWFRAAWLEKLACHVGVRETRHVTGRATLRAEDIRQARKHPDGVARSAYFIDIHSPTGAGFDHEKSGTKGAVREDYAPPPGDFYEVPYGVMVPVDVDNLLVPCRALSATHEAAAAVRVMATMTALGEAAGIAAAMALAADVLPGDVDGRRVREQLPYLDQPPIPWH